MNSIAGQLGNAGMMDMAAEFLKCAVEKSPNASDYLNNLGVCLSATGRHGEAIGFLQRAISIQPTLADAYYNLGIALYSVQRPEEAVAAYQQAIQYRPHHAESHGNLAIAVRGLGQPQAAVDCLLRAIQIKPNFPFALNNLGNLFWELNRPDEAIDACRRAIALDPNYASPHSNLGNAFKEQGLMEQAHAHYTRAVELMPGEPNFLSNLLFSMHFQSRFTAIDLRQHHREWDSRFCRPLRDRIPPHMNDRDPDRRIRIGYVSADFKGHPVGRFLLPMLVNHDRWAFESFCYSDTQLPDAMTEKLRTSSDNWREIHGLSTEQAVQQIRDDKIDVLIDLGMHTAGRLPIFAYKPAPVQISYLAYCSTTGLSTIEYRLTDSFIDPPGEHDADYLEQSIRLPDSYYCYVPHIETPDPGPLPALSSGCVTFACLNNFCKASSESLSLWCDILKAVPKSRLLLHAKEGSHRNRVIDQFRDNDLDPARLGFLGFVPEEEYLAAHNNIDIALDPFPCNGGTTTCDALWMGVPVISMVGETAVGRAGKSILSNVGLAELVVSTKEEYLHLARELASDLDRVAGLRSTLRARMRSSPLTDAPNFTRHAEAAFRSVWRRWRAS